MEFFSEETRRNPYPVYDQMRRVSPILHVPSPNLWMVFDYAGVNQALNHNDPFSPRLAAAATAEYRVVTAEMNAWLPELIAERESNAGLLPGLIEADVSPKDLLGFVQLLIVGGQETTANLINNAVLCLIENPEQLARLRAAPDLLPSAIEEVLRYRSPLQWMPRATRHAVELHGQVIPAGKLVLPMIGSANRDA